MNSKAPYWMISAILLAMGSSSTFADPEMDQAVAEMNDMVVAVNEFAGGVRFDETDVESLIELWDEYSEFGDESDEDEDEDEDDIDFDTILSDPEYRRWAASHSLDADDWLRKTIRITMVLFREHALQSAAMMPEQLAQQVEMIEQQREQLGEEMYQQLKASMETSSRYSELMLDAVTELPQATPPEAAVLESYQDDLAMIMSSEDEDEYYDDYEEDENYEEYDDR